MQFSAQGRRASRFSWPILFVAMLGPSQMHGLDAGRTLPLRTVGQVRQLSPEKAKAGRHVHLKGTVIMLSGWKNSFFFADDTFGISIDRNDTLPEVNAGDVVEVDGVTGEGKFAPVIVSNHVRITGHRHIPGPANVSTPQDLADGRKDSQQIAVQGTVESAMIKRQLGQNFLVLSINMGGDTLISARVLNYGPQTAALLNGAYVRLKGVCGSVFNTQRQFVGPRIFVDSPADIQVERSAPGGPFQANPTPLSDLLRFQGDQTQTTRVNVQGVATYIRPGIGFYLQSGAQGVFIQTEQPMDFHIGDALQVAGYPQVGSYSPKIANAIFRPAAGRPTVTPAPLGLPQLVTEWDGLTYAPYDGALVRVQARLLQQVPGTVETLLLLQAGQGVLPVKLPMKSMRDAARLEEGSIVEVTGICSAIADEAHEVRSVELLLRSAADVRVMQAAPWWTATNALWVVSFVLFLTIVLLAWITFSRRQTKLHDLIAMDSLTGLYNRRGFLLLAHEQWLNVKRRNQHMFLYFVDLDRFKEINDTFGHQFGDEALKTVASVLRECFRKTDVIGRLGGDEFCVVAMDTTESAMRERLERALGMVRSIAGRDIGLEWSIGVLRCDRSMAHQSIEELLARADTLMYEQKREHHLAFA